MQLSRGKSQYSETEAAEELGISVGQLRTMIRSHVVDRDEDLTNVPQTSFQASDLVILRLLSKMQANNAAPQTAVAVEEAPSQVS